MKAATKRAGMHVMCTYVGCAYLLDFGLNALNAIHSRVREVMFT